MAFTGYLRYTTGSTLYAKPLPLNDSAWTDDDVAGAENATLGSYAFASLTEGTEYEVFLQAGGSPANTDLAIGQISYSGDATETKQDTIISTLATVQAKTDLITSGSVSMVTRVEGTTLNLFVGETHNFTLTTDDYTAKTLQLIVESSDGVDIATVADGSMTKTTTSVTFPIPSAATTSVRKLKWALRDAGSGDEVLMYGVWRVSGAADAD